MHPHDDRDLPDEAYAIDEDDQAYALDEATRVGDDAGDTRTPAVEAEEAHEGQDDLEELGGAADAGHTPREARAMARAWSRESRWVGVGYCLRTIRSLFGVAAVYPDAETAWEEAKRKHRTNNPQAIPRGVPVFWTNGGYGHIALSAGGGMCWTTDYRRTGHIDLAPIAELAGWCGGRLVGWTNDLNGVDVWEDHTRKAKRPPFGLDDRIALVEEALKRARKNDAPERRIDGLEKWARDLKRRKKDR